MPIVKKLAFGVPFLLSFGWFLYQLSFYLKDIYLIFSLNWSALAQLLLLVLSVLLTSLFFSILTTLAIRWEIVLSFALVAAISSTFFFTMPLNFLLAGAFLLAFGISFISLDNKLKSYLTFQANTLLEPNIKSLASLMILVATLGFYLNTNQKIVKDGFQIPDSIMNAALAIANPATDQTSEQPTIPQLNISPYQIALLKKNPALLKQYGVDPSILDNIVQSKTNPPNQNFVKTVAQNQIQSFIKPYTKYIPLVLAALFFLTLTSLFSLMSLVSSILLFIIFGTLEKSGYVHFQTETREIKKLVV